jgi:hypothetical protein
VPPETDPSAPLDARLAGMPELAAVANQASGEDPFGKSAETPPLQVAPLGQNDGAEAAGWPLSGTGEAMPTTTEQSDAVGAATKDLDLVQEIFANPLHRPTDWDAVDFGNLHDEGIVTGSKVAHHQAADASSSGATDAQEPLVSQPPESGRARFAHYVTGSLGWIWGMFRAYGGVREEGASEAERGERTRE